MGGSVENATVLSWAQDLDLFQRNKVSLWFLTEMGEAWELSAQGSFLYTFDALDVISEDSIQSTSYLLDLDNIELSVQMPGLLGASSFVGFGLGRFFAADISGAVVGHGMDGLSFEFGWPSVSMSGILGYTGLLLKPSSFILISKADTLDTDDPDMLFGPPRLVGSLEIEFPELLLRQDLRFTAAFQQDLRDGADLAAEGETDENLTGGLVNTQYWGVSLSGPLFFPLYYDAFFYLGTGSTLSYLADSGSPTGRSYQPAAFISFATGGTLVAFFEELLFSQIELTFLYTSGDEDYSGFIDGNAAGFAEAFTPISHPSLSRVYSPLLGNLYLGQASYSIRPFSWIRQPFFENIQLLVSGLAFFRPTLGPIADPTGLNPASDSPFLGVEIDGELNFRPFSDLGFALTFGLFIPDTRSPNGAFLPAERGMEYSAGFTLSLSL
jgi:hypothetical protein